MEIRGKLKVKAGNGKGFLVEGQEGWFNASDSVVPYLEKINKGEEVTVVFEKKGVKKEVIKITKISNVVEKNTPEPEEKESPTGFVCEECGAALKDGKYKKCYPCNKKTPAQKEGKKSWVKTSYDNPEKTAQIQRGNALNAAADLLSGRQEDPETLAEMTLVVAEKLLEWLRAE